MRIILFLLLFVSCKQQQKPISLADVFEDSNANKYYKTAIQFAKTKNWVYDAAYYQLTYPGGDVPGGGACTDVVIRVLRQHGIDLQKEVHEDISKNFSVYKNRWGLVKPDSNIDHRRVYNLMTYFSRKGYDAGVGKSINDYQPGDIVCWEISPGITHIGIYLKKGAVYHNIGPRAKIDADFLFLYKIIGHYRLP